MGTLFSNFLALAAVIFLAMEVVYAVRNFRLLSIIACMTVAGLLLTSVVR